MSRPSKIGLVVACLCIVVGPVLAQSPSGDLPEGPGKEVVEGLCTSSITPIRLPAVPGIPVQAGRN